MRYGKNPTKFARHHSNVVKLEVKVPEALSITTVTYVPRLSDYYQEGLDILKLTLSRIRETTPVPFDLIVFDNGSCKEVIDYLQELKEAGGIQLLILSEGNLKKIGALNYVLPLTQGDYIYYFDSDILHIEGWYESVMEISKAFPRAGLINAAPFASADERVMGATEVIISNDKKIESFPLPALTREQLEKNAEAVGTTPDRYAERAAKNLSHYIVRNGVKALPIANHSHFLIRKEVIKSIFPLPRDWHLTHRDKDLDALIANTGYMRLGCLEPHIVHLANVIPQKWRDNALERGIPLGETCLEQIKNRSLLRRLVSNKYVLPILLWVHGLTFRLIYNVK